MGITYVQAMGRERVTVLNRSRGTSQPDTFICHATEDKEFMARPLHKALSEAGVYAWLDESEIRLGQSIRQKIDEGLANCRSGTVILSRPFFSKNWTQYELDGIVGRKMRGEILLFPIQHGITIDEINSHSPSLAGLSLWNSSSRSFEEIATEIAGQLGVEPQSPSGPPAGQTNRLHGTLSVNSGARSFGTIYVAPAGTPELPEGEEPELNTFAFLGEPTGWLSMTAQNEELEFIIDNDKLRVQVDRGGQWSGPEYQADQLAFSGSPFSVIIRRDREPQIYLPALVSTSSPGSLLTSGSASGWRTFQIQR